MENMVIYNQTVLRYPIVPFRVEGLPLIDTDMTVNEISSQVLQKYPKCNSFMQTAATTCGNDSVKLDTVVTINVNILKINFQVVLWSTRIAK